MTALAARMPWRVRDAARAGILASGLVALSLVVGQLVQDPLHVRDVVALVAFMALLALAAASSRLLLLAVVAWLAGLGLLRRLLTQIGPATHQDPVLIIAPLGLALLVLLAARRRALVTDTRLSRSVLVLSGLILLGSVNPAQGSLFGGIAGLLFVFVPTLGFWVGRGLDSRSLMLVFKLIAVLGVGAALYGLVQTLVGFPSWDAAWIDQVTFQSLNVNGVIRPFASFSSAAEFAQYLAVAIVVWLCTALRLRYLPLAVAALAVLVPALVLESSRGTAVLLLVAVGAMLGAWRRLPMVFAVGLGALLLFGLAYGLRSYGPTSYAGSSISGALVSHEVSGLSDPLNTQNSTVGAHYSLLVNGIRSAFSHPLGEGIGTVTIAGSTFGGVTASTEADPSNMAVALGLPGLAAYAVVFIFAIRLAYFTALRRRDPVALMALGVVVATMLQWFNGGDYSVAFLPWLALGWADRDARREAQVD
jgi:hypothetical protein